MGAFDDLIPSTRSSAPSAPSSRGGAFDDLIPGNPVVREPTWGEWARDLFTGERRTGRPEAEEFGAVVRRNELERAQREFRSGTMMPRSGPGAVALTASAVSPDLEAQYDILSRRIPDLERQDDGRGNIMLRAPSLGVNNWTYLNRPGLSGRDWDEIYTQTVATLPFGAAVGLGRNLATRAAIGGAAVGGSSVAQDVVATALGSEQGVDPTRAAIATGLGTVAGPVAGWLAGRAARPTPLTVQRAADLAEDVAAHERLGVRPFGPGFSQGPVASVARQLAETPVVGAPVRRALEGSIADTSRAARQLADDIAPAATVEQTGLTLQSGLHRYRTAGVSDLEPGILQGMGIAPYAPVQARSVMSAGAAQRATEANAIRAAQGEVQQALTSRGLAVPAARSLEQTITARTTAENLSDAALARLVRAPSSETSFAARQEALYESAWRRIPALFRSDDSANPNLVRAVNANNAFRQILDFERRAGVTGGIAAGRFGQMAERVHTNTTLPSLRSMRTEIGRALSNFGLYETGLDRTQLRQLYGALSRDIEISVQDLANRARITAARNGDPASLRTAREADRALYELRRADRYMRLGIERMDQFARVVGTDNPQQAIGVVIRAAMDGTRGNVRMVRTAMAALRPEERRQVAALVLEELGRPRASAPGVVREVEFSPSTFMTNFRTMAPEARAAIFGQAHTQALDDLARVARRLDEVLQTTNWSRTGTNLVNTGLLFGTGGAMWAGLDAVMTGLASAGAATAAALLFSRPAYVNWVRRYAELRAAASLAPQRVGPMLTAHTARLQSMAASDPALLPIVRRLGVGQPVGEEHRGNPDPKQPAPRRQ